jgi:glucosyl-dolichyl phosphate glucuronosyltransferase
MKISVIVCTYNRCHSLAKALASVAASDIPESVEWEVLIVDNNSEDRTKDVAEEFCRAHPGRFRYFFEPRQGKSFALNTGLCEASGDAIAFMDDDVTVEPCWLQNLTAPLQERLYMGAGGRICPPEELSLPPWLSLQGPCSLAGVLALFDRGDDPFELADPPYGTNMAFRREAFEKYGPFRTDLGPSAGSEIRGEDTEFCLRLMKAGVPLLYVPNAVVHHAVPKKRLKKSYFRSWYFDYGRAFIRTRERRADLWIIPRPLIGIINHLFVMLPMQVIRWMLTLKPKERFFAMLRMWMIAGETTEIYNQMIRRRHSPENIKAHPVSQ